MHTTKSQQRWKEANPEKVKEYARNTRQNNPERSRAHARVAYALKMGKLVRPSECEDCGRYDGWNGQSVSKIEAHHLDYSKPLDVAWVCRSCHDEEPKNITRNAV
jgi:hypothetical protein